MERVAIFGTSGSGKTTLARQLATTSGLRHIEIDAIFHQPNWTPLDDATFIARITEETETSGWVTDGNYSVVRPRIVSRADTVIWLDYGRILTTRRVITRTIKRALFREVLWNGNREAVSNLFRLDPELSIIRWSWTTHGKIRTTMLELVKSDEVAHAVVLRFRHPRETRAWLQSGTR